MFYVHIFQHWKKSYKNLQICSSQMKTVKRGLIRFYNYLLIPSTYGNKTHQGKQHLNIRDSDYFSIPLHTLKKRMDVKIKRILPQLLAHNRQDYLFYSFLILNIIISVLYQDFIITFKISRNYIKRKKYQSVLFFMNVQVNLLHSFWILNGLAIKCHPHVVIHTNQFIQIYLTV